MSIEQSKVFNNYEDMTAFMKSVDGRWNICYDSKGNIMNGTYYVKYFIKPLKKEYTGLITPDGPDARFMADGRQGICECHRVSGDMYNDFVGRKVKITIEVIEE